MAAQPMIVVIPQLIWCFISTKTEIPHDYGGPGSAGAAARLRTALTATTDHSLNGIVCDKRFSYIGHFIYLQY
jgi:hypothetical protein